MSFATYPRKGSITRSNFKLLLESDSVFNKLSDSQQNALIDTAVQRIAAYRNSLSKTDYDFNTVGNPDISTLSLDYSKFAGYAIINAGITYKGTLYAVDTILVETAPTGFSSTLTPTRVANLVTITSSGEFTNAILWDAYSAPVIVTREDDDTITVDVTDSLGVVIIEIFMR